VGQQSILCQKLEQLFLAESLSEFRKQLSVWGQQAPEHQVVPVLLTHAELLDVENLCRLVSTFRSWQETWSRDDGQEIILIITGSWSPIRLHRQWVKVLRGNYSLTPDNKDILRFTYRTRSETYDYLEERCGLIQDLEEIAAVVHEITGGDCELTDSLLDSGGGDSLSLLTVEKHAHSLSARVVDIIRRRSEDMSKKQVEIINQLCRNQCMVIGRDDPDADELEVRGLVRIVPLGLPREVALEFPSCVIGTIFRRNGVFGRTDCCSAADDMIGLTCAANEVAYSLIVKIENLLRNCLVLCLSENAKSFQDAVQSLKLMIASKMQILEKTVVIRDGKTEHVREECDQKTVWTPFAELVVERREDAEKAARLVSIPPSVSYLTTSEIVDNFFMETKLWGKHFSAVFGDKNELERQMTEFRAIRNAVAHNRAVSAAWVSGLTGIHKWLLEKLGRYSSKGMKP